MLQTLHKNARTTIATRKEIRKSKKSNRQLNKELGLNIKTVRKWKNRDDINDKSSANHKNSRSTSLTPLEEATIVAIRQKVLLPIDDLLYNMQEKIPHLTRSSLYRLLKRHGVSRLPQIDQKKRKINKFDDTTMGYFHVDICQIRHQEGREYIFIAVDRVSKYVYIEVYACQTKENTLLFLNNLIKHIPYKIHTILTDNGSQFVGKPGGLKINSEFHNVCIKNNIKHRRTKPYHPWTNGQVERINKTIKAFTVKKFFYKNRETFIDHLMSFIKVYNYTKRLKALKGKTPIEFISDYIDKNLTDHNEAKPYNYQ